MILSKLSEKVDAWLRFLSAYVRPEIKIKYLPRWDWKLRGESRAESIHPPKWRYKFGLVFPFLRYYFQLDGEKNAAWNRWIIARWIVAHGK